MRHGRAKAARKTLQFFARTAGIKAPYHVLLDGTFLVAVVKYKFPLRERLDKVLQHDPFTLYATSSCLVELEKLKEAALHKKDQEQLLEETIDWARAECEILDEAPDFDKETRGMLNHNYPQMEETLSEAGVDLLKFCLPSTETSKSSSSHHHPTGNHKYFVASQDESLLDILRFSGSVPCIHLARGSVLLLENPSKSGQMHATVEERKKWAASGTVRDEEKKLVAIIREEKRNEQAQQQPRQPIQQVRKKRKAREPNPLSCKKRTKGDGSDESKKRRRRKKSS